MTTISDQYYLPSELAHQILALIEYMEYASNQRMSGFRSRTGVINSATFRGFKNKGAIEDAITGWLADLIPNGTAQVRDIAPGVRPDIVFQFDQDSLGTDVAVILEAKPVWHRWIETGNRSYEGATSDQFGRTTGTYLSNNLRQVRDDIAKLVENYIEQCHRHMFLALVFQRPGEVDQRVIDAVGAGWEYSSRHVVDLCNPEDDNIGLTSMVFWPIQTR